jgi:hypothetical protein
MQQDFYQMTFDASVARQRQFAKKKKCFSFNKAEQL